MKKLSSFFVATLLLIPLSVYGGMGIGGHGPTYGGDPAKPGTVSELKFDHTVETLNADRTILITDYPILWFDCNGSDRNVTLPAMAANSTDFTFTIINNSDGAGEDLVVKDGNATPVTLFTIGPEQGQRFSCDGTDWEAWFDSGIKYDGIAKSTIFPSENDAATPTVAFGDGDTGFYESAANQIKITTAGTARFEITGSYINSITAGGGSLAKAASSSIVPATTFRGDENTGIGRAAEDQPSLIAGGVEAQRIVEANSVIYNLLGVTQQDSVTDGESNTSTTISSDGAAGDNFLTTCQVGDAVLIWGGTTTADYGIYWVTAVTDDNNLVIDTALSATDSDIDFYVLRGGILQGPNSLNITGRISNEPITFTYTVAGDITDPLTTSNLLLDGDNDGANETIDLQNGTVPGQYILLTAAADIDADDICTIGMGDTTCTNCCAIVFNKVGENARLTWTGSTWVVNWVKDDL